MHLRVLLALAGVQGEARAVRCGSLCLRGGVASGGRTG